ncbi:hypothetical protein [Reyranella sp.]|uniref:hypothetical protein n=1 Tax=Reyranella sp. TaxID=1929291 RepID=UPI003784867F
MTKPTPKQDDPAQSKRFYELARELGLEDGDDIGAAVKRLAEHGPEPRPTPERKSKAGRKRKPA